MSWYDETATEIGVDPALISTAPTAGRMTDPSGGRGVVGPTPSAAGQFANTQQGFLDWATNKYGPDPQRGQGFVNAQAGGGLAKMVQAYAADTGNTATFLGGPSGDRVDFGQGAQDALTSGGQIWNPAGGDGQAPAGGGMSLGSLGGRPTGQADGGWAAQTGGAAMPAAPTTTPFSYQPLGSLGAFQSPGGVPSPQALSYSPASTPQALQSQQVGQPAALGYDRLQTPSAVTQAPLSYNPAATPTAFQGDRLATPPTLTAQGLATPTPFQPGQAYQGDRQTAPGGFQYQNYTGPTQAELEADPSYQFRLKTGADALENSAASKGTLRTGNTAKALIDYGQGAASQEYAAVDARARATNAANNAGGLGAYNTNTANTLGVNSENYGRGASEAAAANQNAQSAYGLNAQTGLAYNQNANQNALNFGQTNIGNLQATNTANYGRGASEAQQGFQNQFQVNQANNQGQNAAIQGNNTNALNAAGLNSQNALSFGQTNNTNALNFGQANFGNTLQATQANNANNLAFGGQNFQQGFAVNQANNAGQNAAAQGNTTNQLAAQGQQFGQAATGYGLNTNAQLQGQGQQFSQGLAANQQNNNAPLAAYTAATNAALGYGNLGLGYQNSSNNYHLGLGSLGVQQGQLGLQQQGQDYNQALSTFNTNYGTQSVDPWNRNYQLAQLGNPSQNNGLVANQANQGANTIEGQGNVNAAGQANASNAWAQTLGNLGQYPLFYGTRS